MSRLDAEEELRRRLRPRYAAILLTVSLKRPNKNLMRLLDALALIPVERRPMLVLAGHATPYEAELRRARCPARSRSNTRFLGWVSGAELEGLYRARRCFVFPSLYEGFGLPVLEAMARGLSSRLLEPRRAERGRRRRGAAVRSGAGRRIAAAVEQCCTIQDMQRSGLSGAGRENAAGFTWAEAARGTLRTYESAVEYSRSTD